MKIVYGAALFFALGLTGAGQANIVVEPTFQEKMDQSELVFIGTVTAIDRGRQRGTWPLCRVDCLGANERP